MADKNRVWMRQKDVDDLGQDAGWCSVYSYEPAPPSREATLVIHDSSSERVFTESEVNELIKAGNAMSVAMYQYQMDVDDDPPQKHRDMMNAWESAVRRLSDPA